MTQDEIIYMAREAGFYGLPVDKRLEHFAALVAAHEREACAKVCDSVLGENNVSAAIRARDKK